MRRRPDIRAAERAVASGAAKLESRLATCIRNSSSTVRSVGLPIRCPSFFTPQAFGGIVGPSFNWNILNYGRIRNNVRRYEARFQQAAINYQQTVVNADKEIEKALIAFLKAQERAAELQGAWMPRESPWIWR